MPWTKNMTTKRTSKRVQYTRTKAYRVHNNKYVFVRNVFPLLESRLFIQYIRIIWSSSYTARTSVTNILRYTLLVPNTNRITRKRHCLLWNFSYENRISPVEENKDRIRRDIWYHLSTNSGERLVHTGLCLGKHEWCFCFFFQKVSRFSHNCGVYAGNIFCTRIYKTFDERVWV